MDRRLRITDVRLVPGSGRDAQNGLLAYLQFTLNQALLVDGVTLRRSRPARPPALEEWHAVPVSFGNSNAGIAGFPSNCSAHNT